MVFNVTGGTSFSDIFTAANSSTNNILGIVILVLVYVVTYVMANRSGYEKAIVPTAMIGFIASVFFWVMGILSAEYAIFALLIFAAVTALTWGD